MKKSIYILTIMLLIGIPPAAHAQGEASTDPVIEIFNRYEEREGIESITISPALFGMMKNGKSGNQRTRELLQKITGLRILTVTDSSNHKNCQALTSEIQTALKNGFEEIIRVKNASENSQLYIRTGANCKNCTGALIFIASEKTSLTILHLAGAIDKSVIDAVLNNEIGISNQ